MGKDEDEVANWKSIQANVWIITKISATTFINGMTEDYLLAIKHHATHLRMGRKFYELLD